MSTDLERLEGLVSKLVHDISEIRTRSASNLLFKLSNGVVKRDLLCLPNFMKVLTCGLLAALKLCKQHSITQQSSDFLLSIIKICRIAFELGGEVVPDLFSSILDELYQLAEIKDILGDVKRVLEDTIQEICSVKTNTHTEAHTTENDTSLLSPSLPPPSTLHATFPGLSEHDSPFRLTGETLPTRMSKGAGAILDSKLCIEGWRFPSSVLTESDEKFLFDVEVKIRMGNGYDVNLLYDVLADFPADVIVSRKGLLCHVLDCAGSALVMAENDYTNSLSPWDAVRWLSALLSKAINAFRCQLDGELCSTVPKSPLSEESEFAESHTQFSMKLANEMYRLRTPLLPHECEHSRGVTGPSLTGLAFSICAACLPLLKLRTPIICAEVTNALKVALPCIFEPHLFTVADESSDELGIIEIERFQHLIRRMEQIVEFHQYKSLGLFSYLNDSEAEDGYDSTQLPGAFSCDIAVAHAAVEILSIVPRRILEALQPGESLISYLTSIAVSNNLAAMSSPNYPLCVLLSKAKKLLRVICPNETDDLEEAISALKAVEAIVDASLDPWKAAHANKGFLENLLDSVLVLETIKFDSIDCIGRILSAILLCVRAILPVANESENFSALISSVIQRLFTNCGPLVRRSCVNFVNQTENSGIIEKISTREVVSALLCLGILDPAMEGRTDALCLLEKLLTQVLCECDESMSSHGQVDAMLIPWADLLSPLKMLCFEAKFSLQWPVVEIFTDRLEDLCSQIPELRNQYFRSLVTGLFHTNQSARVGCSIRIRHQFEIPYPNSQNEASVDPFSVSLSEDESFISELLGHCKQEDEIVSRISDDVNVFELKDVRKLSEISLFGDFELAIRISALHQLLSIVESDRKLLKSLEAPFTKKLAVAAMTIIESTLAKPFDESSEEAMLLSLSLALIMLLVRSVDNISDAADFNNPYSEVLSDSDILPVHTLVKGFLPTHANLTPYRRSVRAKCGAILLILVLNLKYWVPVTCENITPKHFTGKDKTFNTKVVYAPSFLLGSLICVRAKETSAMFLSDDRRDVFCFHVEPLLLTDKVSEESASFRSLLSTVILDGLRDDPYVDLHDLARMFVRQIDSAKSHSSLHSLLACSTGLMSVFPVFAICLLEENLMSSVAKYFSTLPKTSKDCATLCKTVEYLTVVVSSVASFGAGPLCDDLVVKITEPLLEAFTNSIPTAVLLMPVAGTMGGLLTRDADYGKPKPLLQIAICRLLNMFFKTPSMKSTCAKFVEDSSVITDLVTLFMSETTASSVRNASSSCLEMCIRNVTLLKGSLSSIVDASYSVCKLLRAPDTLKASSSVVASLRLLICTSTVEYVRDKRDWRWLMRYIYDRRASVRMLALELLDIVLTMEKSVLHDEENSPGIFIMRVLQDPSEASSIRVKASSVFRKHFLSHDTDSSSVGQLVRSLLEILHISTASSALAAATEEIFGLFMFATHDVICVESLLEAMNTFRGFDALVSLLGPDFALKLSDSALTRLNLLVVSDSPQPYNFEVCSKFLVTDILAVLEGKLLVVPDGWNQSWKSYQVSIYSELQASRAYASRTLQAFLMLDAEGFKNCLKHTNLLRNLISCASKQYAFPNSFSGELGALARNLNLSFSAFADLIGLMMSRDKAVTESSPIINVLVQRESSIPASLIAAIARRLTFLASSEIEFLSIKAVLVASLRLLCIMADDDQWRVGLGLGGPFRGCPELSGSSLRVLTAIVNIRGSGVCGQSVDSMIDLCISLFAQYSYHARLVLLSISDDNSSSTDGTFLSSITDYLKEAAVGYINAVLPLQDLDASRENTKAHSVSGEKWRSRVRGYKRSALTPLQTKQKEAATAAADMAADLGPTKLKLWSSLILLKSVCSNCTEVQSCLMESKFENVLSALIRLVPSCKSVSAGVKLVANTVWTPSEYQLAAAILATAASFSYENVESKRVLSHSGDSRLQLEKAPKTGSTLHQLAAIGLSPYISRHLRRLCLSMASELVRETVESRNPTSVTTVAQKTVLARTVSLFLQDSLSKTNTNPDDIVFLVDLLASCICSGQSVFASGVDGIRSQRGNSHKPKKYSDSTTLFDQSFTGNDSPPSIPSLISWIWELHCNDAHVISALMRMIGSIADSGGKNRRILANITEGEATRVIVDILTLRAKERSLVHDQVHTIALVALWGLLNNSEQARADVKVKLGDLTALISSRSLLNSPPSSLGQTEISTGDTATYLGLSKRATGALSILLQ